MPLLPQRLGELAVALHRRVISSKAGKLVLAEMVELAKVAAPSGGGGGAATVESVPSPVDLARRRGLLQSNDEGEVAALVAAALADPANTATLARYRAGHERVAGVFVSQVLAASGGRANPTLVARAVSAALGPCPPRKVGAKPPATA